MGLFFLPRRALDIYKSNLNTTHNFDTRYTYNVNLYLYNIS